MSPNVAASIRARLLSKAKNEAMDFQFFLVRYACERFLYRLGASEMRDRCILKGASLLALWMDEPHRATRDIDLLAFGENDEETVRGVMVTVCNVPCPEDGLSFDLATLRVSSIRDQQRYSGQRARLTALLGTATIPVQVDFGFGDAVTPGPVEAWLPTLLGEVPAPFLRTYPQVSSIAEKFESMVQLGIRNSRMKDFYDIWALSESFAFDGTELQEAVALCFNRRGTLWTTEIPDVLTAAFYSNLDLQSRWAAFGRQSGLLNPGPDAFEEVGAQIQAFLGPVRVRILADDTLDTHWPAGGPWQMTTK